jgi:hypothetical protein
LSFLDAENHLLRLTQPHKAERDEQRE